MDWIEFTDFFLSRDGSKIPVYVRPKEVVAVRAKVHFNKLGQEVEGGVIHLSNGHAEVVLEGPDEIIKKIGGEIC